MPQAAAVAGAVAHKVFEAAQARLEQLQAVAHEGAAAAGVAQPHESPTGAGGGSPGMAQPAGPAAAAALTRPPPATAGGKRKRSLVEGGGRSAKRMAHAVAVPAAAAAVAAASGTGQMGRRCSPRDTEASKGPHSWLHLQGRMQSGG